MWDFFGMIIGAIIGTMGIEAVSVLIKNKMKNTN